MSNRPYPHKKRRAPVATAPHPQNRLAIRDIYFGKEDATAEIQAGGRASADDFYETFYVPEGLSIDAYLKGTKFFVYGLKGTGKTSLLRYLIEHVERSGQPNVKTDLFTFGAAFPQHIHDGLRTAYFPHHAHDEIDKNESIYTTFDYEDVWLYVLLKRITESCEGHPTIFADTPVRAQFLAWMDAIEPADVRNNLFKYMPNIRLGKVRLKPLPGLDEEIAFDDPSTRALTFKAYVERAVGLYGKLRAGQERLYVMIDEIEPRIASGVLFEVDSILIRDIIVAVRRLNLIHTPETRSVHFIAAVRSEVLDRVRVLGKEIQKGLEQFGFCMNWGDVGAANIHHPLIKMVCHKIAYSERKHGILSAEVGEIESYIWPRYFRSNKRNQFDPKALLDLTWFRPRDLVRLMSACVQIDGASETFSEGLIARARKRYSINSWGEISQQLTLPIDPFSLGGLEICLTAFQREFTLKEFAQRMTDLEKVDTSVERLVRKYRPGDIVRILYDAGVLGEIVGGRARFVFRGDGDTSHQGKLTVHKGLIARFSMPAPRRPSEPRTPKGEDGNPGGGGSPTYPSSRPGKSSKASNHSQTFMFGKKFDS